MQDREVAVRTVRLAAPQLRLIPLESAARAYINGAAVELEEGVLTIAANQPVGVRLEVRDYLTMRRQIQLGPNESREWQVQLVPIPGPEREQDWSLPYLNMPLQWVGAGSFQQGSPLAERGRMPNEGPRTRVVYPVATGWRPMKPRKPSIKPFPELRRRSSRGRSGRSNPSAGNRPARFAGA